MRHMNNMNDFNLIKKNLMYKKKVLNIYFFWYSSTCLNKVKIATFLDIIFRD